MARQKKNIENDNTMPAQKGRNPDGTFAVGNVFSAKYDDKYADMLIEFFSKPMERIEYSEKYNSDGICVAKTPIEFTNDFPTMGMFARSIGVSLSTVRDWAGVHNDGKFVQPRFAIAYACVLEWAGEMIESGALSGKLDSNMAKFVLTNNYGKQEKHVIDNNIKGLDDKDMELIRRVEARLNGRE